MSGQREGRVRPEHFRPHFAVDERMRVRMWPTATASALGIRESEALGRPCWQLLGDSVECGPCRLASGSGPEAGGCARLRTGADEPGWMVWTPPALISEGPAGSSMLESVLVRGVLAAGVARHSLEDTLEAIRRACAANDCELFLRERGQPEVAMHGCVGPDREAFLQCTRMPVGVGYPGRVTATGKPLFTNRFQTDRRFRRPAVKECGVRSFIGVPLMESGQPIGYLGLGWKEASIPIDWGVQLLEAVRPIAAIAARAARRRAPPATCTAATAVQLRCLGPFALVAGDRTFDSLAFPRRKALDLLRHLLLARGAVLARDVLIERLWPEVEGRRGANRLHVTLNALRAVLAEALPGVGAAALQSRHGDYRLDLQALGMVDAFAFADAVHDARARLRAGDPRGALARLEQAMPLYRGELFQDADDIAFEAPRQRFRAMHRQALQMLVDLYRRDGRHDAARLALEQARACDPDSGPGADFDVDS